MRVSDLFKLCDLYNVHYNKIPVRNFLYKHKRLIPIVAKIIEKARNLLPNTTLKLDVYTDPEIPGKTLTLYIDDTDKNLQDKIWQLRHFYHEIRYNDFDFFIAHM